MVSAEPEIIELKDIKDYLESNPPKTRIRKVLDPTKKGFFSILLGTIYKKEEYLDIQESIVRILSDKNEVILSDSQTTIVIFDKNQNRLVKAKYDINKGQVVPISSEVVKLDNFKLISPLFNVYFYGNGESGAGRYATASFLEVILELSDVPLLEIGEHTGDTCNIYLPVRKYQRK